MPLFRTHREGELLIGIWKTDETTEQLLQMLDRHEWYREAVERYGKSRLHEWLAVRVLLKTLCGEEKEIAYHPSGRPYLRDGSFYISISHTRGYVAVALHSSREVGLDIEQYGTRVKRVASRFIRPDEESSVRSGDEIDTLLIHWSAKETLFKLMHTSEVDFIGHLHILPFAPAESGSFQAREYRTEEQRTYEVHYLTHPDFVLTWAMK